MAYDLLLDGAPVTLDILARRPGLCLMIDGAACDVAETAGADGAVEIVADGHVFRGWRAVVGDEVHLRLDGRTYVLARAPLAGAAGAGAGAADAVRAAMPGTVIAVHCRPGDRVAAGDRLLTIESMKLQTTVTAAHDGVVAAVHFTADASFERGAALVTFAAADAAGGTGRDGE